MKVYFGLSLQDAGIIVCPCGKHDFDVVPCTDAKTKKPTPEMRFLKCLTCGNTMDVLLATIGRPDLPDLPEKV